MITAEEILEHHGIKGMKWGVRRDGSGSSGGAAKPPVHADSIHAQSLRNLAKAGGTHALSNADLKKLNERMNLEQNYSRLVSKPSRIQTGQKFAKKLLDIGSTVNQAIQFANSPLGQQLKGAFG